MNKNQSGVCVRMERLQFCNWYSRMHQERYWKGSPWRAFQEALR